MHRSQHQLAFGTGPACVLMANRIAAGRDAMAACKAMGLPGGRGSPIGRRDRDGSQAACPIRVLRLARLATSPPASASAAANTASDATGHLGWLSGWAGGVGACTRGCQGSPTWPSVGGRRASPLIADWWVGAWRWCQDSPTWPWVGGRRSSWRTAGPPVAWAMPVMPTRLVAASRAPSTRGLGEPGVGHDYLRSMGCAWAIGELARGEGRRVSSCHQRRGDQLWRRRLAGAAGTRRWRRALRARRASRSSRSRSPARRASSWMAFMRSS